MNIVNQEEKISLKISSKLEYLMKKNKTKAKELSNYIGITEVNFSRIRNRLKEGKFPTVVFVIGISNYFDENFLKTKLWKTEKSKEGVILMLIQIGWMKCKVKYQNKVFLSNEEVDGLFIPRKNLILINKNLPKDIKLKTLYHELFHAILFVFGRVDEWQDETLVETLASAFLTIRKQNKKRLF